MIREIGLAVALEFQAGSAVPVVSRERRRPQTARTGVNQQGEPATSEPNRCRDSRVEDLRNPLYLAEMVSSADGAKRGSETAGIDLSLCTSFCSVAFPWPFEIRQADDSLVEFEASLGQVEDMQLHATPDIGADYIREDAAANESGTATTPPAAATA